MSYPGGPKRNLFLCSFSFFFFFFFFLAPSKSAVPSESWRLPFDVTNRLSRSGWRSESGAVPPFIVVAYQYVPGRIILLLHCYPGGWTLTRARPCWPENDGIKYGEHKYTCPMATHVFECHTATYPSNIPIDRDDAVRRKGTHNVSTVFFSEQQFSHSRST